eukprot:3130894-Prorocentrum_lima.AAC.1
MARVRITARFSRNPLANGMASNELKHSSTKQRRQDTIRGLQEAHVATHGWRPIIRVCHRVRPTKEAYSLGGWDTKE